MVLKHRRIDPLGVRPAVGKRGASSANFMAFLLLLASASSVALPAAKALAQTRITMMPPQISSPEQDIYIWGDRLIISFRISGDATYSEVGVKFAGDYERHTKQLGEGENLTTFELQLDSESAPYVSAQFAAGQPYVYAQAIIARAGQGVVAEQQFWVMNPARRWPDALRFVEPPRSAAAGEIKVAVSLPDDRVDGDYFLDLIQLPMRLPGGTVTTAVPKIEPLEISEEQREYKIPTDIDSGVYEIRLRGPGGYVHDLKRFQHKRRVPEVSYTYGGLMTEPYQECFSETLLHWGRVEVSNYPADVDAKLYIRSADDVQVAGKWTPVVPERTLDPVKAENWNGNVCQPEPGEFELTTSYLGDEIVLGRFLASEKDAPTDDQDTTGDTVSLPDPIQGPGSAFTFEVGLESFLDGDHVWVFLRQNVSGRQPSNAPSSTSDRLVKRWKVPKDARALRMAAPGSAGEYRIDVELPNEEGDGPSGIVSYAVLFSVIEGESGATIEMAEGSVIMGSEMNFQVQLDRRPFTAPITIEAVRPAGVSSAGVRFASRTPPLAYLSTGYKQTLWSARDMESSVFPNETHPISWGTRLWAPGRYEARVILGNRVLARKSFEVIVPSAPGAIASISIDEENPNYVVVDVTLPDWADTVLQSLRLQDYGFYFALVRPRSRTLGNALRFEETLETISAESFNFYTDGQGGFRLERPSFGGELEVWLLMDVNCFADTCPTAILDRKSFFLAADVENAVPSPDHIADRFIFPEDTSFDRPGRAFPDIHPG